MSLWADLAHPPCFPNCSCESMALDCILCQPFAFWSSLAYLISGIFLHYQIQNPTLESRYWIRAIVVVTFASFFAHASFTNLALAIDMAAIIVLTGFIHFPRYISDRNLRIRTSLFLVLFTLISGTLFLVPLDLWVPLTFLFFTVSAFHLWRKTPVALHKEKGFILSMVIYGLSFCFFIFDKEPWLCGIKYFPYGHTIWHLGSALTTYLFGRWYFVELPKKI